MYGHGTPSVPSPYRSLHPQHQHQQPQQQPHQLPQQPHQQVSRPPIVLPFSPAPLPPPHHPTPAAQQVALLPGPPPSSAPVVVLPSHFTLVHTPTGPAIVPVTSSGPHCNAPQLAPHAPRESLPEAHPPYQHQAPPTPGKRRNSSDTDMVALKQAAPRSKPLSEVVQMPSGNQAIRLRGQARLHVRLVDIARMPPPPWAHAMLNATPRERIVLLAEITQPPSDAGAPERVIGGLICHEQVKGRLDVAVIEADAGRTATDSPPNARFLERKPDRIWLVFRAVLCHTPAHVWNSFSSLALSPSFCVQRELFAALQRNGVPGELLGDGRSSGDDASVSVQALLELRQAMRRETSGEMLVN